MIFFLKNAFISTYTLCKIPFSNLENIIPNYILKPTLIILTILSLLLISLIIFPFVCYRYLIYIYLKFKYGKDFVKMLNFVSTPFFVLNDEYATTRSIFYVQTDDPETLETKIMDICRVLIETFTEFRSSVEKCSGYYYLLKRPYNFDEIFSTVSFKDGNLLTEVKLANYIAKNLVTKEKLFQMRFFKEPLKNNTYAVLILASHGILDGHSLWMIVHNYVYDNQDVPLLKNKPIVNNNKFKITNLKEPYVDIKVLKGLVNDKEPPICKGPYIALFREDEVSLLPKIKFLRRKFNCSINELFLGIIMFTVCRYMRKNLNDCLEKMNLCYIHHINEDYLKHFREMYFPLSDINQNVYILTFEIDNLQSYNCFEDFIEDIRKKSQEVFNSVLLQISYAISKGILDFLPEIVYRNALIRQLKQPCSTFTNLGTITGRTVGGKPIVGGTSGISSSGSGIYFSLTTCDDRLQLMLSSKLHFLNSQEEIQAIMDSCIACIHELYEQIIVNSNDFKTK